MRLGFLAPNPYPLTPVLLGALMLLCAAAAPVQAQDASLWNGALRWRMIGPYRGGRTVGAVGHPRPAERLLHRRQQRRRLEDRRLRPHLESDLRWPAHRFHRHRRRRSVRSQHPLRRQRRRPAAARPLRRRRRCTTPLTPEDVDAPRLRRRPADRLDHRRPARPQPLFVAVLGHPYGPNDDARRVPVHRRRRDLARRCSTRTRTPAPMDLAFDPASADTVFAVPWVARQPS